MHLPEKFRTTIIGRWGQEGEKWLAALPGLLQTCEERFGIILGDPLPNSAYNYVAHATTRGGEPVILKIGFPESDIRKEMQALDAFHGKKAVHILEKDDDLKAMLLHAIRPGTELSALADDEEATRILADMIHALPAPVPQDHAFPTVGTWMKVIERLGSGHPLPPELLRDAQKLYEELDADKTEDKLLHGDLHHENVLSDDNDGWTAIDPHGVIGDPVFEVGALFHNPHGVLNVEDPSGKLRRRVDILTERLGCERRRVIGWGFVHCVLSACWSAEDDEGGWEETIRCAQILHSMLQEQA